MNYLNIIWDSFKIPFKKNISLVCWKRFEMWQRVKMILHESLSVLFSISRMIMKKQTLWKDTIHLEGLDIHMKSFLITGGSVARNHCYLRFF